jgi:hypothetical protein
MVNTALQNLITITTLHFCILEVRTSILRR